MTYFEALIEARAALQRRRRWYAVRAHWPRSRVRAVEIDHAIGRINELVEAARQAGF